jgi:transposase
MELLHAKCAGLDVHKDSVVACVRIASDAGVGRDVKTFDTTTSGLLALSEWLGEHGCTHVVMEATGIYWKPVWHVLEEGFELVLANAAHVKNVPGRKTDVNDATWLAELLAHGLVQASFVPDEATQQMRALLRTRKQLVREQASHVQRVQKVLEDANIKLSSVVADILGRSGRALLDAIAGGTTNADELLKLAGPGLKTDRKKIREALRGRVTAHHRFLLKLHLDHIDNLAKAIARIDTEVGSNLEPFRCAIELLKTIPGVSDLSAQVIASEIGVDMQRFPTSGHLISWAGLCPRNDESAGKRRSTRIRKGAPWLKTVLVQCAWAAARSKNSYLRAQYYRLKSRRGGKKAVVAVAASILTAAYYMLRDGTLYSDLGSAYLDRLGAERRINSLVKRLTDLGCEVQIKRAA